MSATEKILQFGEGNFLRAFADWMVDLSREQGYEGKVVLVQPRGTGAADKFKAQNNEYTVVLRGLENGKKVDSSRKITCVSRCISANADWKELLNIAKSAELEVFISNTTEAGIVYAAGDKLTDAPPSSFPAKVTAFLYERFKAFNGDEKKGLLFLPTELIDYNGAELKKLILKCAADWQLEPAFAAWVEKANKFTNTLVDRIVTGHPKDMAEFDQKLGYHDELLVASEPYNLWVIEGKKEWADILPLHKTAAQVIWTDDVKPYKTRKVRLLNGSHTGTVLAAYLAGHNIVLEFMNDPLFSKYLDKLLFEEIIPTLDLPETELKAFANAVKDRFANPFIKHNLLDISLNSTSKFNARCLPSLLEYVNRKGKLPQVLTFSLAAFIKFYDVDASYKGRRADGAEYTIKDDPAAMDFFAEIWKTKDAKNISRAVLSKKEFWSGKDLTETKGLEDRVAFYLNELNTKDINDIVKTLI